ncbi:uncharacterized protein LOC115455772 [Manduca sexta]|uniref:uncharacterized protein LOC115455772 n=1 Tax=Manduca sexta TaxID=7130 RepID=UPI001182A2FF|nr:uncharacterized protein LOC115455772 [Manduca sexta]
MFMQPDTVPGKLDEGFSRPVESIMRCEDFKSNFARKLSNRYISRPVSNPRQDSGLKQRSADKVQNVPERIEPSQLSKTITLQSNDAAKQPDKQTTNSDIRNTEVNALNMEVETLRWQLSQTESNRQMHIALLKQIVTFLSRVKEHIECQKPEDLKELSRMQRSFNLADLPRSRSVLYVNKNADYSLSPTKKINTRKISKSINNVNGYKECSVWSQSKLSLTSETETAQKLTEEMSRLITLANTVLSTKLPDLACTCSNTDISGKNQDIVEARRDKNVSTASLDLIEENATAYLLNTICDNEDNYQTISNKYLEAKDKINPDFIDMPSSVTCGLENNFTNIKIDEQVPKSGVLNGKLDKSVDKTNEYNNAVNFMEDESGFSSMSSFQEIGIPIISIIPPSPCKEVGYHLEEFTDILNQAEKWKNDSVELDKQTVKVFWV